MTVSAVTSSSKAVAGKPVEGKKAAPLDATISKIATGLTQVKPSALPHFDDQDIDLLAKVKEKVRSHVIQSTSEKVQGCVPWPQPTPALLPPKPPVAEHYSAIQNAFKLWTTFAEEHFGIRLEELDFLSLEQFINLSFIILFIKCHPGKKANKSDLPLIELLSGQAWKNEAQCKQLFDLFGKYNIAETKKHRVLLNLLISKSHPGCFALSIAELVGKPKSQPKERILFFSIEIMQKLMQILEPLWKEADHQMTQLSQNLHDGYGQYCGRLNSAIFQKFEASKNFFASSKFFVSSVWHNNQHLKHNVQISSKLLSKSCQKLGSGGDTALSKIDFFIYTGRNFENYVIESTKIMTKALSNLEELTFLSWSEAFVFSEGIEDIRQNRYLNMKKMAEAFYQNLLNSFESFFKQAHGKRFTSDDLDHEALGKNILEILLCKVVLDLKADDYMCNKRNYREDFERLQKEVIKGLKPDDQTLVQEILNAILNAHDNANKHLLENLRAYDKEIQARFPQNIWVENFMPFDMANELLSGLSFAQSQSTGKMLRHKYFNLIAFIYYRLLLIKRMVLNDQTNHSQYINYCTNKAKSDLVGAYDAASSEDVDRARINVSMLFHLGDNLKPVSCISKLIYQHCLPIVETCRQGIPERTIETVVPDDSWLDAYEEEEIEFDQPIEADIKAERDAKESELEQPKKTKVQATKAPKPDPKHAELTKLPPDRLLCEFNFQLCRSLNLGEMLAPSDVSGTKLPLHRVTQLQQSHAAHCMSLSWQMLQQSKIEQHQEILASSFFHWGHGTIEQSLTAEHLKTQGSEQTFYHPLSRLLDSLKMPLTGFWTKHADKATFYVRYPFMYASGKPEEDPIALRLNTQRGQNAALLNGLKEQFAHVVDEAMQLQLAALAKDPADNAENQIKLQSLQKTFLDCKLKVEESSASALKMLSAEQAKLLDSIQSSLKTAAEGLHQLVSKAEAEKSYHPQLLKTLKNALYHLNNLASLPSLLKAHFDPKYWIIHAHLLVLSSQYLAENIGIFLALQKGQRPLTHDLFFYASNYNLGSSLSVAQAAVLDALNVKKGSEYLVKYFWKTPKDFVTPIMEMLDNLTELSRTIALHGEGFTASGRKELNVAALQSTLLEHVKNLSDLSLALVNAHLLTA